MNWVSSQRCLDFNDELYPLRDKFYLKVLFTNKVKKKVTLDNTSMQEVFTY